MLVHLFGAVSSPSCVNMVLHQTAKDFGSYFDPGISDSILNNFYVDDFLKSAENPPCALDVMQRVKALCKKGHTVDSTSPSGLVIIKSPTVQGSG